MDDSAATLRDARTAGLTSTAGLSIDLNADMGEGFGRYSQDDEGLLGVVTSASIACGFHAGDPVVMRATVANAAAYGVVVGAHPGYPDLVGFGRREMAATPAEIEAFVVYQVGALDGVCRAAGTVLRYVKPHGALYNRAARDRSAADAIARAVRSVDSSLALLALDGSEMIRAADRAGLRGVREGFVDRAYDTDGMLVPRTEDGAVLEDIPAIAERAVRMIQTGAITDRTGKTRQASIESLCTHGDGPHALAIVRAVRVAMDCAGIAIAPFARG